MRRRRVTVTADVLPLAEKPCDSDKVLSSAHPEYRIAALREVAANGQSVATQVAWRGTEAVTTAPIRNRLRALRPYEGSNPSLSAIARKAP